MIFDVLGVEGFVFPSVEGVLRVRSLGLRGFGEVDWQFMRTGLVEDVLGLDSGWVGRRLGDAFGEGRHVWFDEVDCYGLGLSVGEVADGMGISEAEVERLWGEGLRRLVLADAGAFMVEVSSRRAGYEWRRVSTESVPTPEAVKKLADTGADAWRLVELFNGKFDEWSFEKLAEGLGFSEALLLSRGYRWGAPRGWSLDGWNVETMSKRCGMPVEELVGMQDDGLLLFESCTSTGGDSKLKVADFQFVAELENSWDMTVCPVSLRLVRELLALGWSAEDTARFLEVRSPWFGLVPPIEYARLGDEFLECVLYVAKVRGASAVRWRYKER